MKFQRHSGPKSGTDSIHNDCLPSVHSRIAALTVEYFTLRTESDRDEYSHQEAANRTPLNDKTSRFEILPLETSDQNFSYCNGDLPLHE